MLLCYTVWTVSYSNIWILKGRSAEEDTEKESICGERTMYSIVWNYRHIVWECDYPGVCAWGTSKYAFDGSGVVDRHSIYHYEHGRKVYNYSLCTFQNGKIYNCDLSAAQNIGARFFLREYQLLGAEGLPATPQRTLCTLRTLVSNGLPVAT